MKSSGMNILINVDEMLLQYYPKVTNWIDTTNAKRVGSN